MLTVEITSMPGVEQLLDVLPPLLVARAGDVRVRELVDERDLGLRASTASTSISSNVVPRYSMTPARDDLEIPDLRGGVGPAVRLDVADDDIGAALVPSPALVEHRERLADAGRGTEVDAEPARAPSTRAYGLIRRGRAPR